MARLHDFDLPATGPVTRIGGSCYFSLPLSGRTAQQAGLEFVVRTPGLMRRHDKTIAGLARSMKISQVRVRLVRQIGVSGAACVQDWMEAITGDPHAGWATVARAYL